MSAGVQKEKTVRVQKEKLLGGEIAQDLWPGIERWAGRL